jgi:acetylornithine deacetylase/succinyl-diaminopimelate desuccinylase-like protein
VALLFSARCPLVAQLSSSHSASQASGGPTSPSPAVTISSPSPIGDTTALAKEAQGWLIDLIRTNTTNPPGNEQATAKYLAHILEKEGIQSEMLDVAPGRSALVARLRSSAMADPSKALLLVAHMDVVGVDRSKWTVDPFAAMIKDGYLYGRGSIDDKGMLAANLAAFIALKRSNARLNRDVIFLATADEEQGGDASIKILISKYWDKFAAGYALNEGGEVFLKNGRVQYVAVQASEKVAMNVAVVGRGTPSCTCRRRSRRSVAILRLRISPP